MKKLTSFFVKNQKEGEKKKFTTFENLVIIVVVGVIIILAGGFLTRSGGSGDAPGGLKPDTGESPTSDATNLNGEDIIINLEERLSNLLSKVEGAGLVEVMIFADSSSEMIPAYNDQLDNRSNEETQKKSLESSERRELALSGDDNPVILKVEIPEIRGVVVVAGGADDFLIRQELNNAVCTLLGVPEHRVHILKHK